MITYNKDESISITGWSDGITSSPINGFNDMRLVDTQAYQDVVTPTTLLSRQTPASGTLKGAMHYTKDNDGNIYAQTQDGEVWAYLSVAGPAYVWTKLIGTPTTGANGEGLVYWKGCLFAFRHSWIDVCTSPTTAHLTDNWIKQWSSGPYTFTVTAANATVGATYTNNSQTFTVVATIAGATTLVLTGTGDPQASGTLTKASGTGDATITFSAYVAAVGQVYNAPTHCPYVSGDDNLYFSNHTDNHNSGHFYLGSIRERVNPTDYFTITAGNATIDAVYSNNGATFRVIQTIIAGTTLFVSSVNMPTTSGVLTKVSGTGDNTLTFSSFTPAGPVPFDPTVDRPTSPYWDEIFNPKALDLPYSINCITDFGADLMLGTEGYSVYPWDRTSDTWRLNTESQEIKLPERWCRSMIVYNNILYIFIGATGTVYATNGSTIDIVARMPAQISNYYRVKTNFPRSYFAPGSALLGDKILFGFHWQEGTELVGAVFSYDTISRKVCIEGRIPNNVTPAPANPYKCVIYDIASWNDRGYMVGWSSDGLVATTYAGIAQNHNGLTINANYSADEAYVDTELFRVGTYINTRDIHQVDFSFLEPLSSSTSDGIKIYYRKTMSDAWTLWFSYSVNGIKDFVYDTAINDVLDLQVRLVINGNARLKYLRLILN